MSDIYKSLFDKIISSARFGMENLEALVDMIEETGNSVIDKIDQLSVDELYEDFFGKTEIHEAAGKEYQEWFQEKEEAYRRRRAERREHQSEQRSNYENNKRSSENSDWFSSFFHQSEADPYRILGVSQNAQWNEIRTAFILRVKTFHPDSRGSGLTAEEQKQADQQLLKIYGAWEYFQNNKRKFKK
jgi:hypothetical protein